MYIEPNTKIRLIKNCPLDKNYENTIYFTTLEQQITYFTSTLQGLLFDRNTYQRVNKGTLRIAINAEAIYNYNYLAFQNYAFGDRWFYAFITKIEYVSNVLSEISYEIDVMQTWHFSYELEQCFVEREHSVTDNIGDNLVEEKLDTGEYICSGYTEPADIADETNQSIVLFATMYQDEQGNWHDYDGDLYHGLFSGLIPISFPNTVEGAEDMASWIHNLPATKATCIVSGCVMPTKLVTRPVSPASFQQAMPRVTSIMRSDGIGVKNKKCLTYPYNFCYVTNFQGKAVPYRYEFFSGSGDIIFRFSGGVNPNPSVFMYPLNYKGVGENADEGFYLSGWPQIPWNIDSFKAWLAQNASSVAVNGIAAAGSAGVIASVAVGAAPVAMPTIVAAGILGLAKQAVSGAFHAMMPPQSKGNTSGAAAFQAGNLTFGFMNKHITPEFATIIDDYFTMYGYATNKLKVPNRNARPEWNYIKTIGCKINGLATGNGGVPAEDAEKIENIYNNGVRFWNNPVHIGNYSYDNSPRIQGGD